MAIKCHILKTEARYVYMCTWLYTRGLKAKTHRHRLFWARMFHLVAITSPVMH